MGRSKKENIQQEIAQMEAVAHIHNGFHEKFGVPRQSGLVEEVESSIVMAPAYRTMEAFRGIEDYSHLWLLWVFDKNSPQRWSATVRPPRLGGNTRVGVFATRSPFRPNGIGLSLVRLLRIEKDKTLGPVLTVAGADLTDGTAILDIKPYLPYVDSRPEALGGFAHICKDNVLKVVWPEDGCKGQMEPQEICAVEKLLEQDPRPAYQEDEKRIYGMCYQDYEIKFRVEKDCAFVCGVERTRI